MSYEAIYEAHQRTLLNAGVITQQEYERRISEVDA